MESGAVGQLTGMYYKYRLMRQVDVQGPQAPHLLPFNTGPVKVVAGVIFFEFLNKVGEDSAHATFRHRGAVFRMIRRRASRERAAAVSWRSGNPAGVRLLGAWLARLALLPQGRAVTGGGSAAGRGSSKEGIQGHREGGDKTAVPTRC